METCQRCQTADAWYELYRYADADAAHGITVEHCCRGCMTPSEVRIASCDNYEEMMALCLRTSDATTEVLVRAIDNLKALERDLAKRAEAKMRRAAQ